MKYMYEVIFFIIFLPPLSYFVETHSNKKLKRNMEIDEVFLLPSDTKRPWILYKREYFFIAWASTPQKRKYMNEIKGGEARKSIQL